MAGLSLSTNVRQISKHVRGHMTCEKLHILVVTMHVSAKASAILPFKGWTRHGGFLALELANYSLRPQRVLRLKVCIYVL